MYDVTVSRHPRCSCPDNLKGNLCKHILFVMIRVLGLAEDNVLIWQRALLSTEVGSEEWGTWFALESFMSFFKSHVGLEIVRSHSPAPVICLPGADPAGAGRRRGRAGAAGRRAGARFVRRGSLAARQESHQATARGGRVPNLHHAHGRQCNGSR